MSQGSPLIDHPKNRNKRFMLHETRNAMNIMRMLYL